jgi:hypothetical protein
MTLVVYIRIIGYTILVLLLPILECNRSSNENEIKKYGENKEIFLGYKLGMNKQTFYDRSWKLNDKGLVKQGPKNQSVRYELSDELNHPAEMYFYPSFHNERIYQMRVRFEYSNWAPWNDELHSDKLLKDVLNLFKDWYGEGFTRKIYKSKGENRTVYIKTDKSRRVSVTRKKSKAVMALIADVVAAKEAASDD